MQEIASIMIGGFALAGAAGLVTAGVHKWLVLARGEAARLPIINSTPVLRRWPRAAVAMGAAAELLLAGTLVAAPAAGLVAGAALLVGYATLLARLPSDADCGCFGRAVRIPAGVAARRNAVLATAAAASGGVVLMNAIEPPEASQATVGCAAVLFALMSARLVAGRWASLHSPQ